jgi:hypothetical protein
MGAYKALGLSGGFFVVGIKKRGGPFFCAIAMLKKDFRYIKINKKIPQKSAE